MNRSHPSKKYCPLIISCFMLILITAIIFGFFFNRTYYDPQGTNLTNFKNAQTKDIDQEKIHSIEQIFQTTNNNLARISWAVKNEKQPNTVGVTLFSWPENQIIFDQKIDIPISEGYQYITIKFTQIENSQNKTYKLSLNPSNSQDLKIITVNKDRYPSGQLFINDTETNQSLVFNFHYFTNKMLQLLIKRLPIYKPWFFQYSWAFIFLFFITFMLVAILTYYLTKAALTNSENQ